MSARVVCAHPACNRSYESKAFMLQHYTDSHRRPADQLRQAPSTPNYDQKRSPCKRCNRSFSTAAALDQHFVDVHLSEELLSNTKLGSSSADHDDDDVAPPILQEPVEVACNDCGKTFKTTDALHQHQWDSAEHMLASRKRMPNSGSEVRECSQCDQKFSTANDLEQHFVDQHPLSEVPESDDEHCTWQYVAGRFHLMWKKPSASLHRIHRVFKVYNPGWRRKGYEEYRKELKKGLANKKRVKLGAEEDMEVRNKVLRDGNELERFHGTKVKCGLAQLGAVIKGRSSSSSSSLCSDPGCSLCRILQSGFKTSHCKMDKFQRFGRGIYCSSISSKADDYVWCSSSLRSNHQYGGNIFDSSSCKVMMMCKVLAGRLYRSTQNLQDLHSPPPGFHSVQGEPGEVLNYDELVVYDDRAILPEYIILYSTD